MTFNSYLEIKNLKENQQSTSGKVSIKKFSLDNISEILEKKKFKSILINSKHLKFFKGEEKLCFNFIFSAMGLIFRRSSSEITKQNLIDVINYVVLRYLDSKSIEYIFLLILRFKKKQHFGNVNTDSLNLILETVFESKGNIIILQKFGDLEITRKFMASSIELCLESLRFLSDFKDNNRLGLFINRMHQSVKIDSIISHYQTCLLDHILLFFMGTKNNRSLTFLYLFRFEIEFNQNPGNKKIFENWVCILYYYFKTKINKGDYYLKAIIDWKNLNCNWVRTVFSLNPENSNQIYKWSEKKKKLQRLRKSIKALFSNNVHDFFWGLRKITIEKNLIICLNSLITVKWGYLAKILEIDDRDLEHWIHFAKKKHHMEVWLDSHLSIIYNNTKKNVMVKSSSMPLKII